MSYDNAHSGFNAGNLHSPPPTRKNWDDVSMATSDIPLQDASSPHVQFASRQPSIIPSPVYPNSPSVHSTATTFQSPAPLHSSVVTSEVPAGWSTQRNFGSDTFAQPGGSEKIAVEGDHNTGGLNRNEQDNMGYDMYNRSAGGFYGNTKGPYRSDGFMPLGTNEDGLPHQDTNEAPSNQPQGSYRPYLQQPAADPSGRRNIGKRLLFGPMRRPWFSWITGLAMAIVVIVEFVKNNQLTGGVIATSPFNPMIGPSFMVLVNMGARYTPCMRPLPDYTPGMTIANCYRTGETCTLEELCGFGGFGGSEPDQSFRFVAPIFMHAGVIHYLINMMTHLRLGADLECLLGIPRYILLYLASGIWGFVLSATLSQTSSASMGCSGALFGLIGYMFVDIAINWKTMRRPGVELMKLLVVTIISLVLGLLPGLDNFAHIGGFAVGIVMGAFITPLPDNPSKRTKLITLAVRVIALVLLIIMFAVTITSFYKAADPAQICPNCKYLSCLPVNGWCDM